MSFHKGQPAYPDGRRLQAAVQRSAREEAQQSIAALAQIRDDPNAPTELRAKAAFELLALGRFRVLARPQAPAMAAS